MPKNKRPGRPTPPRRLVEGAIKAANLIDQGKPAEAVEILKELDKAFPNTPEVLGQLANAYTDLRDAPAVEPVLRRLARLQPGDPDIAFALAGAYSMNLRPGLARRAFLDGLRRWPDYPDAGRARKDIELLETLLRDQAAELEMDEDQAFELLTQHDEARFHMAHGDYRQARRSLEDLLRRYPNFAPALNNLAQIEAVEGRLDQAIQTSLRILEGHPENIHALSNLARLHFLTGRPDEAEAYARRLKESRADAADRWTKIAEALSFLGDDAGLLALYDQAKAAGELEPPQSDTVFYHLLATAACFLDKEKNARKYWEKALKINPNFDWAQQNLADLDLPPEQRAGPWAYPFGNWLLGELSKDIQAALKKMKPGAGKPQVQEQLSRLVEQRYPQVFFLAPHLAARGDENARQFVVHMAAVSAHPALVEAAKEVVLGRRGSLQERARLAQVLSQADLLPSGIIDLWAGNEKSPMMLMSYEISTEPEKSSLPRRAHALAEQAHAALYDQDGEKAEALLKQALAIAPDDPSLLNNLAMAYSFQDREAEARRLILEVHARFPDYFFGVVAAANIKTQQGDLEQAHKLLDGLMGRKRLHYTELVAMCQGQINVLLAEGEREGARSWLEMWEQIDPDNPSLDHYRFKVGVKRKRLR